ncbi:MAG TPA: ribosome biogenesis GTP-binding protein YihA/YsxC [Acidobacteriaceae bacterium]
MRLNPTFLLSATDPAHFPTALKTHNAPEVAFLGRSNVGKSSLINALLGSKQAHVSSTPGRTRAINFFALHEGVGTQKKLRPELILADLPGYGYAKISKSISAEWPKFIEPYLAERETLALCVCLIDTNVPPQSNDAHLLDFLRQLERPFVVVGTKADKLSSNQLNKSLVLLKREHQLEEILTCSAKTSAGLKALWARMILAGQK